MDLQSILKPVVWVPLLIAGLGILVIWSGVRSFLKLRRLRASARRVEGLVVEMKEVFIGDDMRPFGAPVIEYAADGQIKRFQADPVARLGTGRHACTVGDRVTVMLSPDTGSPMLDQPMTSLAQQLITIAFGIVVFGVAFVVRLFLIEPAG
jgi:hypothetical protein